MDLPFGYIEYPHRRKKSSASRQTTQKSGRFAKGEQPLFKRQGQQVNKKVLRTFTSK